jgi:arylsulfatase A-like enzyme
MTHYILRGLLVGMAIGSLSLISQAADSPPNVLVFLADDAGWGDYSVHGNQTNRTPNIDSIAKNGARFERFFVCPVCAPTRAEFLTGRYHPRGGVRGVSTGQERLDLDEQTVAEAFRKAGYSTAAFGKWHNGSQWPYHPMARGFEQYYGYTSGHWGEYFDPPLEHNGQRIREQGYVVDLCTQRAIDFIEANQERPFFCYVPFTTPHSPWSVPENYWSHFKNTTPLQAATEANQEVLDHTRCAYAMLENQDDNVGKVLKRLDELKIRDNTIVLYFSDNGPNSWRWNDGMKGRKGSLDEGGIRSPLFISWPGKIEPGQVISPIAGAIDLLPTLLSMTQVPRVGDRPLDGVDLSPLILGKKKALPERTIFTHQSGNVSARTSRYRLDPQGGLFDMQADPNQKKDIREQQPEVAKQLTEAVAAWKKDVFQDEKVASNDSQPKKKNAGGKGGKQVIPDQRAYPVGYREFPWTPLPARDGVGHGMIQRSSGAPNCSYFVNWKSKDDSITWDVEVNEAGTYAVVIEYTCPMADAGSTIVLSLGNSRLTGVVQPGWDPPLYTTQDTIERPAGESQMKPFKELPLGEVKLEKGRGQLVVKATDIPGSQVMDLLSIHLILKH